MKEMQITGEPLPNFFSVLDLVFLSPLFDLGYLLSYFLLFLPLQTLHNVNCRGMAASMMDYT